MERERRTGSGWALPSSRTRWWKSEGGRHMERCGRNRADSFHLVPRRGEQRRSLPLPYQMVVRQRVLIAYTSVTHQRRESERTWEKEVRRAE